MHPPREFSRIQRLPPYVFNITAELKLAARRRGEDIRGAVEAMSVRHLQRDIGPLSVSIGVATFPDHADSPDVLKRLADEALYRAKHAGRNRVETANPG